MAHAIFSCLCGLLFLPTLLKGQENEKLVIESGIEVGFKLNSANILSLDIENTTSISKSVSSNIGGVFDLKFMEFPLGCSLQLRSSDNAVLVLKNQKDDGWMDPSIYSSILMSADKIKAADEILETIVPAMSLLSYPIQYANVFKLISANLSATHPKPHQFRVKCKIKVLESGVVRSKEITSAWILCAKVGD